MNKIQSISARLLVLTAMATLVGGQIEAAGLWNRVTSAAGRLVPNIFRSGNAVIADIDAEVEASTSVDKTTAYDNVVAYDDLAKAHAARPAAPITAVVVPVAPVTTAPVAPTAAPAPVTPPVVTPAQDHDEATRKAIDAAWASFGSGTTRTYAKKKKLSKQPAKSTSVSVAPSQSARPVTPAAPVTVVKKANKKKAKKQAVTKKKSIAVDPVEKALDSWIKQHRTFLKKTFDFTTEAGQNNFLKAMKATQFDITTKENQKLLELITNIGDEAEKAKYLKNIMEECSENGGMTAWVYWAVTYPNDAIDNMIRANIEDGTLQKRLEEDTTVESPENLQDEENTTQESPEKKAKRLMERKAKRIMKELKKDYVFAVDPENEQLAEFTFNYLRSRLIVLEKLEKEARTARKNQLPEKWAKVQVALRNLGHKGLKYTTYAAGAGASGWGLYKVYPYAKPAVIAAAKFAYKYLPALLKYKVVSVPLGLAAAYKSGLVGKTWNYLAGYAQDRMNGVQDGMDDIKESIYDFILRHGTSDDTTPVIARMTTATTGTTSTAATAPADFVARLKLLRHQAQR